MKNNSIMIFFQHRIKLRIHCFLLTTEKMNSEKKLLCVQTGRSLRVMANEFGEVMERRRLRVTPIRYSEEYLPREQTWQVLVTASAVLIATAFALYRILFL